MTVSVFQFLVDNGSPAPTGPLSPAAGEEGLSAISVVGLVLIGLVVFGLIVISANRFIRFLRKPELYGLDEEAIAALWQEIERTATQGVMGSKLAIIEADKLLDNVLKSLSMPGETLGERLKVACYKHPHLRKVWSAHKLRNQLVHDTTFELSQQQAKAAINDYRAALRALGLL